MQIKEEFVTFETAQLLRECGFPQDIITDGEEKEFCVSSKEVDKRFDPSTRKETWTELTTWLYIADYTPHYEIEDTFCWKTKPLKKTGTGGRQICARKSVTAPTHALAMKWLREERKIYVQTSLNVRTCSYSELQNRTTEYFPKWVCVAMVEHDDGLVFPLAVDFNTVQYHSFADKYEDATEAGIKIACRYLIHKQKEANGST